MLWVVVAVPVGEPQAPALGFHREESQQGQGGYAAALELVEPVEEGEKQLFELIEERVCGSALADALYS